MDRGEIEAALDRADAGIESGSGVRGTGFWKAVGVVKRDPSLVEDYADRIGDIDRRAFEAWALITVPASVGTALMVIGTLVGLGLVWAAYSAEEMTAGILLLLGMGITLVTTHGLAHQVVAAAVGMNVTHWFIGAIGRPQPGVKVDYATYLRTPAKSRAWMHASGAIMSKAVPFFALGPAFVIPAPGWATAILIILGIGQIVTDVLWSTKASDWKKFKREMAYAR